MAAEHLVQTFDLTKKYGSITAVENLNLEIDKGTIFGLLGPNGAGKTTTILMILGLTEPNSGKVLVNGHDAARNPLEVKSMVGYLPDNVGFYRELTGRENLKYTAALNGLSGDEAEKRITVAIERVNLKDAADRKTGEYSRGMRQRLGIADVLVKDPQLIILDEPTLGIDPEGVRELLALIKSLARDDNKTILISSHLLHQVQEICDKVGIFVKGKLISSGTIDELVGQIFTGESLALEIKADPVNAKLVEACQNIAGVQEVTRKGDILELKCERDVRQEVVAYLVRNNFSLQHLHLRGFTLDDLYQRYFQKEVVRYD